MFFENYVNLAKTKSKIESNNKLAKCLGISSAAMANFIAGKATPSPETVLKVANYAGLDEKEVLMNLLIERFEKYPTTKKILLEIKSKSC